ncbi:MAG: hypothetical protein JO316_21855 [Abitibacteriaceae bacterium]|nr:hypothetical protein [Abditibacteriaceae bacterium]
MTKFLPARPYIIFAATLALLTWGQILYCTLQTPKGWQFSGFTCDIVDQNTYLAFMAQARDGHFFLQNLYTGEIEKTSYCNLFWWTLGVAARWTHLSLGTVFQGSRVLLSFAFLLLLARFIGYFIESEAQRWCALLLITLGTGFGWLFVIASQWTGRFVLTADLVLPEAFAIMSMLWKTHLVFSLILQVSILWLFLAACESRNLRWAIGAALLALLLGFTHAFHLITIYCIALVFGVACALREPNTIKRWQPLQYAVLLIIFSAPSLLYFSRLVHSSPIMAAWQQQNICLSPPVWSYLVGFGPVVGVLFCCPRQFVQRFLIKPLQEPATSPRNLFLFIWLVCNSLLLYSAPIFNFERRLVQSLQIPLTLIAAQLFFDVLYPRLITWPALAQTFQSGNQSRLSPQNTIVLGWVLLSLPTTLYHFTATSFIALPPHSPYYLSPSELGAADYLRQHAKEDAVILAPEEQGSWLPILTERHVFIGHPVQTVDYARKSELAARFFSVKMSNAERIQLLHRYPANFIYWPHQKDVSLPNSALWTKVFGSPLVEVYEVKTSLKVATGNPKR